MHPLILTSGMDGGSDAWWLSYGLMGRQTVLLNLIMTFQEGDQEFQILRKGYARRRNRCSVGKVKCSYLWPVIQVNMWPNHCWDHYSRISRHRYLFISLFILSLEVEWCLWLLQLTISARSLQVFYSKVTTCLLTPSFYDMAGSDVLLSHLVWVLQGDWFLLLTSCLEKGDSWKEEANPFPLVHQQIGWRCNVWFPLGPHLLLYLPWLWGTAW